METNNSQKTAQILSIIILILAVIASLGGLFLNGLYRDNTFVRTGWRGNDFVTLVIAVPLLIIAMVLVRRGSLRAELIWLGMLEYMLYNYAYYLFGAAFNWFFLIYVALFVLSAYALIFGLVGIDATHISKSFRARTPVKWISGYMLFIALGLSVVYITQSLNFILNGVLPPIIERVDHPTNVVFALDFSFLVSLLALGGVWLWKRKPWGYVISGIALVKGATYTLVLSVVGIWSANAGIPGASEEVPIWAAITLVGTIVCFLLYWNLDSEYERN